MTCREMDVVHLGVHISLLGFSLFIGAISFSAWRYPLKEKMVTIITVIRVINSRQLCNCMQPIYMLLRKYIKTSVLRNCVKILCLRYFL